MGLTVSLHLSIREGSHYSLASWNDPYFKVTSSCVDVWMHRSSFSFPRGFLYLPRGKKRSEREAYGLGKSTLSLCYVTRKTYSLCIHTHTHMFSLARRDIYLPVCSWTVLYIALHNMFSPWMNINYLNNSVDGKSFVSLWILMLVVCLTH